MKAKVQHQRGLAVLRVSSRRQEDGFSHDLQEQEVRQYAAREGIELVDIVRFIESAKKSGERKQYDAAIQKVLSHKIENLLFYQQDREARNQSDLERNEQYVKAGFFKIHYVRDRKVLKKDSSSSDFLTRDLQGAINKEYSRNLSIKVSDAMRHKAETGVYPSNRVPLGYKVVPLLDENGFARKRGTKIVVDPSALPVVLKEFEMRAKGLSIETIRREALDLGLVPAAKRKTYSRNSIEARLKNPFYRGHFIWQGGYYAGTHELFIPQNLLAEVDRSFGIRGYTLNKDSPSLFSGWVRCGHSGCGCQLTFDPKTKVLASGQTRSYSYYRCTNGKRAHKSLRGMNVKEDELFRQFENVFDLFSIEEAFANEIAEALKRTHQSSRGALEKQIDSETLNRAEIDRKIALLTEKLLEGALDADTYKITNDKLAADKQRSDERLKLLSLQNHDAGMETAQSIIELATKAKSLWLSRSPKERRDFLELLVSNPLWEDTTLRYDLKKPLKILSEMKGNSKWCTQLGSNQQPPDS
jgi:site-specific DNA recombinase